MILFRADGNPWIGTGHIMRCLSFADALRERGLEVEFVTAEHYFQQLIESKGYVCTMLGSAYDCMEEELPVFCTLLEQKQPRLVVLDSYYVTPKYMETLKKAVPLLYIDDLNAFDYPADFVLNYNVYGPEILYPAGKVYFLGPEYAPLRKEFQGLNRRVIRGRPKDILISTGGTDPYHVALHCARFLQKHTQCTDITYHFILGVMNSDVEAIEKAVFGLPNIKLHQRVKNMCSLMQQCDAAISAAGSTLYELCACGIPTVTYVLADNQIFGAQAFQKIGLMSCAGDVRTNEKIEEQIFAQLFALVEDEEKRKKISLQMQRMVDGNGAGHLADTIMRAITEILKN